MTLLEFYEITLADCLRDQLLDAWPAKAHQLESDRQFDLSPADTVLMGRAIPARQIQFPASVNLFADLLFREFAP